MTLEEAIKIQTIHNDHNPDYTDADRETAHQLGIEALKRCRNNYLNPQCADFRRLPGETEE